MELTSFLCPLSVFNRSPVFKSHIIIFLSNEPLITYLPSGETATDETYHECPLRF
ncbi:MAG: hypothetical protein ACFE8T_13125 [Promethearchaeota archaeon]